jgi:dienelactone hydrolase
MPRGAPSAFLLVAALVLLTNHFARADELVTFDSARYLVGGLQERLARERADTPAAAPAEKIQAYLSKPAGNGPFPAVVHLHGCGGLSAEARAAAAAQFINWGYATLVVDSFTTRGITEACLARPIVDRAADAWGALNYLSTLPFVDAKRIAVVGYSQGGIAALQVASLHDAESFEMRPGLAYKAAAAYYPSCSAADDQMTMPTLVMIGELDDWSSAKECDWWLARRQGKGAPVKIVVYPGAFHSFDNPRLTEGSRYFSHWLKYDAAAAERAATELHNFLTAQLSR